MSISGVLIIDKPSGMTSHDVVARVRRKLKTRKVGHAGTLDPDVTGVLVLCIGDATRLIEYLTADQKAYEGRTDFGVSTTTDDATGAVTHSASARFLTEEAVIRAAKAFEGRIEQTVPAYSAVHIDGKRAYDLAREGVTFELPKRWVEIYSLAVWGFVPGERAQVSFRVSCSKGTYIRSLCRDWGVKVGVPAHMSWLRRIQSGQFGVEQSIALEAWEMMEYPEEQLLPLGDAVQSLPAVHLSVHEVTKLSQGQVVIHAGPLEVGVTAVFAGEKEFAAIADVRRVNGQLMIVPKKVFWKKAY